MYPKNSMYLLAALVLAICCAAPLLVGAALTAGLAAGLAVVGLPAAALAVAVTGIVIIGSRRRIGANRSPRSADEIKHGD